MNFKAARCPTCGGALQVPDDLNTVKCMYCGGEVVVREAIQLAAGRVREFTEASPIEEIVKESLSFSIEKARKERVVLLIGIAGFGLFAALLADGVFGISFAISAAICGSLMWVVRGANIKKLEEAKRERRRVQPERIVVGYKGQCPYCDTSITLPPDVPGTDCPACNKRVVIRDSKFYSVDTPVSGIQK